jgi:hypothetical protein
MAAGPNICYHSLAFNPRIPIGNFEFESGKLQHEPMVIPEFIYLQRVSSTEPEMINDLELSDSFRDDF